MNYRSEKMTKEKLKSKNKQKIRLRNTECKGNKISKTNELAVK